MKTGFIKIQNGLLEGRKYSFLNSASMGRDEANSIQILDPKVSRVHARVNYTSQGFHIRDLDSTNGTFINGTRRQGALLAPGDTICLGTTRLTFAQSDLVGDWGGGSPMEISAEREALSLSHRTMDEFASVSELRRRLEAILKTNEVLGSGRDLREAFDKVLEEIFHIVRAERGVVLAVNEEHGRLEIISHRRRNGPPDPDDLIISHTILRKVLEESVGILVYDAQSDDQFSLSESVCHQNIRSALCVPFLCAKEIVGVLYLDVSEQTGAFSEKDLDLLMAITRPASIHIQNSIYTNRLRKSYRNTVQALANAVDARDPYTIGHNRRVSRLGVTVGSFLGWPKDALRRIELGGIFHDIGKIGISDTILLKSSKLDQQEWQIMRRHPEIGTRIISGIGFLKSVIPSILYHHEAWNGGGYPYGLRGKEIPKEGRLLAVCDAFDAMSTKRPYREAMKMDEAVKELLRNRGKQFDPSFVRAFISAYESGKITAALRDSNGQDQWNDAFRAVKANRAA